MRILVCGSRKWTEEEPIRAALQKYTPTDTVITGGCSGADTIAHKIAVELKLQTEVYPVSSADWKKYGPAAGPIRNQRMLKEGKPNIVLAFPKKGEANKGTKNMIELAEKAKVPVAKYMGDIKVFLFQQHVAEVRSRGLELEPLDEK